MNLAKVPPRLRKAELIIGSAAHFIGIVLVLAVVVPKTDSANLILATPAQRLLTASRTTISRIALFRLRDVAKRHRGEVI